jgi:hypothetical protein
MNATKLWRKVLAGMIGGSNIACNVLTLRNADKGM